MYHMGVIKALIENGAMPGIISGTSGGSIVVGVLGIHSDQEMLEEVIADDIEGEPDAPNVDAPPTEPEDDGGPNVLAWSTLGASAAVGVTSLITGVVGHGIAQDLDEDCPGGVCPADRRGDANRGRALARTSTALMFVAAAGAATSLVLFLVGGEDADRPEPAAHLELAPLPGGAFVSARVDL